MKDMMLLVEPMIPALRRYARSLLRDRSAADDLLQDCLERAITRWHQRRNDGDARTWLFTILHNLAISRLRQLARRGHHVGLDQADEDVTARPATQEDGLRHREVLRALETLPEEQRSVLLLVTVEDLSYAEAAQVLDIPVGTVMSRLSRAREKLSRALSEASAPTQRPTLRRVK
ncbi:MAG TPA: sigma-70 family RNA polymerase sigma factor [Aliidongia sp.]|uniref:sigma-70 family RNA polymerase sigma factor n=1 Tax=Aliidongia sp. TaxID=1914230 RepID=UPI002DDCE295|nr:sigma-70 family RNA polymerase sigma factor [Aliidongia sp.]HEV2676041.1 sigma-70 family RNA polymerase sigma factor [Aliidongia sp.]